MLNTLIAKLEIISTILDETEINDPAADQLWSQYYSIKYQIESELDPEFLEIPPIHVYE